MAGPAPFGVLSPGEEAAQGPNFLDKLVAGIINGTVQIPKKVIDATVATAPGLRREDFTDVPAPMGMVPWQPGDDMRLAANEAAVNLAGIGTSFAVPGAAGIFGGRLAATADKAALAEAEKMAAAGADRKEIWDKTGWFKGGDDKWRFEIPDDKAVLNPNTFGSPALPGRAPTEMVSDFGPLASQLWHSDLYAAYPDARRAMGYMEKAGAPSGSYSPRVPGAIGGEETINVAAHNVGDARSVALHEVQHLVQGREGFAQGGSPAMFKQGDDAILSRDALSWRREMDRFPGTPAEKDKAAEKAYREMGAVDWMPSKEAREIARHVEDNPDETLKKVVELYGVDKQTTPFGPQELYRALPGEIEARNVQTRADMTPAERRAKPPWETEHWADRAASSPTLERLFGSGSVGSLESAGPQMSLPMDEAARMARAAEQGFNIPLFHKTNKEFTEFAPNSHFGSVEQANMRAVSGDASVMPVLGRGDNFKRMRDKGDWSAKKLKSLAGKHDGVVYLNRYEGIPREAFERAAEKVGGYEKLDALSDAQFKKLIPEAQESYIIFDPKNARSRFARFDPENRNKAAILGGLTAAAPVGLLASMASRDEGF